MQSVPSKYPLQRVGIQYAMLNQDTTLQYCLEPGAGQAVTVQPEETIPNPGDFVDALLSPVSRDGDLMPRPLPAPPPFALPPQAEYGRAQGDVVDQLQQLMSKPTCPPQQPQSEPSRMPLTTEFTHLHPAALAAVAAVASSKVVAPGVPAEFPPKSLAARSSPGVSECGLLKPMVKRTPRIRRYARAKPSRFCHVCARPAQSSELLACKNVSFGVCRKAVCQRCFEEQGWNWSQSKEHPSSFSCCHCRRDCPSNAQCRTYQRTNERRRVTCMRKRMLVEDALANGGDVEAILRQSGFM